jgi:hypothetical protein
MSGKELVLRIEGKNGFVITVNNFEKVRDFVVERSPLFGIKKVDYSMRRIGSGCVEFAYRERVGLEKLQHLAQAVGLEDSLRCTAEAYEGTIPRPAV